MAAELTTDARPIAASAFTTAPAITTVPGARRAEGLTTARGWTRAGSNRSSIAAAHRRRASLSPIPSAIAVAPPGRASLAASIARIESWEIPGAPPQNFGGAVNTDSLRSIKPTSSQPELAATSATTFPCPPTPQSSKRLSLILFVNIPRLTGGGRAGAFLLRARLWNARARTHAPVRHDPPLSLGFFASQPG